MSSFYFTFFNFNSLLCPKRHGTLSLKRPPLVYLRVSPSRQYSQTGTFQLNRAPLGLKVVEYSHIGVIGVRFDGHGQKDLGAGREFWVCLGVGMVKKIFAGV